MLLVTNTMQFYVHRKLTRFWRALPIVPARIVSADLVHHNDVLGLRVYAARILFVYEVNGVEYESDTPAVYGPQIGANWGYTDHLLEQYRPGEQHPVRYIPGAPAVAYLEVAPLNRFAAIVLPAGTLLYAVFVIGYFWWLGEALASMFGSS